jgi:hypothetical protein
VRLRRVVVVALSLSPLPLVGALVHGGAARALPAAVVSVRDGDLYVGGQRITATPADDAEPDWSPDGRRVVFSRQERGRAASALYVVRRDGGGLQRLTPATGEVAIMPAWSPDGRRIAYAASPLSSGSFDIWVLDLESREMRRFTRSPAEEVLPSWSLDGKLRYRSLQPGMNLRPKTSDRDTPQSGPRELLPDFDQRAPFRLTVSGTRLGFASATDNVGAGPVWIRGSRDDPRGQMNAEQLVRLSDGSVRVYDRAGRLRYTPESTHSHWHLLAFQRYELRDLTGKLVVRDRKSGFCLADHYGLARNAVAVFRRPRFLGNCEAFEPRTLAVEQGTSPGYTDLYPPHFHGQNLELRGVRAGVYILVHRANPDESLEELDYANNAASLRIRLTWRGRTPLVETLRRCAASDRC